jgi:hypothetical protein
LRYGWHYGSQDEDPAIIWAEGMSDISDLFCLGSAQCGYKDSAEQYGHGDANTNLTASGSELQQIVNIAPRVIELVCRKIRLSGMT